jgi:phospholipid-binding lipoprotein MlaA
MSVSVFTVALWLASAPVSPDDAPSAAPVTATVPVAADAPPEPSEIVVTGRSGPPPGDPLETVNKTSFEVTQSVDKAIVGPVALAYGRAVPSPVRSGIRNALGNLHEPVNFMNFVLQHKIGKAVETFGRFAINSTIGVVGLVDVAKRKPFNLPVRYNGFANTLGFYGMKPGPFFFLPLVGATTVRDFIGFSVDKLLLPTSVGKPFNQPSYNIPTGALSALDHRNETDAQIMKIRDGDRDPYAALRESYLQRRQAEIDALHVRHTPPLR